MNISLGTHINMVFGGPLRHGIADRVTYNTASERISVWEQRVTRCELKSTFLVAGTLSKDLLHQLYGTAWP